MAAPQLVAVLPEDVQLMVHALSVFDGGLLVAPRLRGQLCPSGAIEWDLSAIIAATRHGARFWSRAAVRFDNLDRLYRVCQPNGLLEASLRYLKLDTGCVFTARTIRSPRNGDRPAMMRDIHSVGSRIVSLQVLVLAVDMNGCKRPAVLIDRMWEGMWQATAFEVRIAGTAPYRTPQYLPPFQPVHQSDLRWAAIRAPFIWRYDIVREIDSNTRVCFECNTTINVGAFVRKCTLCNLTSFCSMPCRNASRSSIRHPSCCIRCPPVIVSPRLRHVVTWDGVEQY